MHTGPYLSWHPEGSLCLWAGAGTDSINDPWLSTLSERGVSQTVNVAVPDGNRWQLLARPVRAIPAADAVGALMELGSVPAERATVRAWLDAARFALELAVGHRVIPSVAGGAARWRVSLVAPADRDRFENMARSFPTATHAIPSKTRPLKFPTAAAALRGFLDTAVDSWYRSGVLAGPGRGWVPELAQALSGASPAFTPRDARSHGVPDLLAAWAAEGEATGLRVGLRLEVPDPDAENPEFVVDGWLGPMDEPTARVPLEEAFRAGVALEIGERRHPHPALAALRGLARAARLFPPLEGMLHGPVPRPVRWTPVQAWPFLKEGVKTLRDAGFGVELPPDLDVAGRQRIRARLRLSAPLRPDGTVDLTQVLQGQWEIVLGDLELTAQEFSSLNAAGSPLVSFRGQWVLLDPTEIQRLPTGWNEGHAERIPAAEALRAILTGELGGVPVVADDRLNLVIEALRNPPDQPVPPDLIATLRPYQVKGYAWLSTLGDLGLGACLADDMGLGKTVQLIAHLLRRRRYDRKGKTHRPSLVVCPTSVLGNWQREIRRFAPSLVVTSHHGQRRDPRELEGTDVVLTTYGLLVRDRDDLASIEWDVVALDEAQGIKNPESQRAKAARSLIARHRVALSGTPVENRLDELWSLMEFLVPGLLGGRTRFQREVAVPIERFGDENRARELKLGVAPFLLRRMKTDPEVISDLPDKIEKNEYCPLTAEQAALYRATTEEYLDKIVDSSDIERRGLVLSMLTRLKQICNHPVQLHLAQGADPSEVGGLDGRSGKLERAEELVDAIVDNNERLLVFTQYTEMGSLLCRHFSSRLGEEVPFLHGGTPQKRRDEMVREFQEEPFAPPLLVVSLRAGGTGLNLTRATHVIHYDRWWNPAIEDQATDRAYRIGQRRDVQVHKLVTVGTLEERIDQRMNEKRQLAESVVGSGERWITELDDAALRLLVMLGEDALVEGA